MGKKGRKSLKTMTAEKNVRICPNCGKEDGMVAETRMGAVGVLRRRRECPWCGTRWNTAEIDYDIAVEAIALCALQKGE